MGSRDFIDLRFYQTFLSLTLTLIKWGDLNASGVYRPGGTHSILRLMPMLPEASVYRLATRAAR